MKLHENKELFRQSIQFTAQQMGIPAIFVEKDYWVTFALYTIFKSSTGSEIVFKGGTSLLKCHLSIERFSEDIDLIVLRRDGESNNKMKSKIGEISRIVSKVLPEVEIDTVTQKMGMNRKTAHVYTKEFEGNYGQIRDVIILEATWLGYHEPYAIRPINSFIYEMMLNTDQEKLIRTYDLLPFNAQVLETKRTFCEKIMSLVRFSYGEEPVENLKKKIRHIYDLYQLMQSQEIFDFFNSTDFDKMLLKVAYDDIVSFKNNNKWLQNHPMAAILFANIEKVWGELKPVYNGDFKNLVFGHLPKDEHILVVLHDIKKRLSAITWEIQP